MNETISKSTNDVVNRKAVSRQRQLKPGTIRYNYLIVKWEKQLIANNGETIGQYKVKCRTCGFQFSSTINRLSAKCKNCKKIFYYGSPTEEQITLQQLPIEPQNLETVTQVVECQKCKSRDLEDLKNNPELLKTELVNRLKPLDLVCSIILSNSQLKFDEIHLYIELNELFSEFSQHLYIQKENILFAFKDLTGLDLKLCILSSSNKSVGDRFE